ncbi:Hypothetical protein PHPALM_20755 [Phytophthora palmivora]|uniref:Uncharacterized protein n=1 Tax=Phytophthora palmivora TaxID=4796 RepID=A0A2P4XE20_9STRA|nr:Hypothetical protein PHPALM_20755 [Phytophthora palmivora]
MLKLTQGRLTVMEIAEIMDAVMIEVLVVVDVLDETEDTVVKVEKNITKDMKLVDATNDVAGEDVAITVMSGDITCLIVRS